MTTAPRFRILVVEDDEDWRLRIAAALRRGSEAAVDTAASPTEARPRLEGATYDLITLDRALERHNTVTGDHDDLGTDLLREIRQGRNRGAAVLVVTAFPPPPSQRRLFVHYGVFEVLPKDGYRDKLLQKLVGKALLDARLKLASEEADTRHCLTLTFDDKSWQRADLVGPERKGTRFGARPVTFDGLDLIRRADVLNVLLHALPPDRRALAWCFQARSLGKDLYESLLGENDILSHVAAAQDISMSSRHPLWIEFTGTPSGLSVPMELMHDGNGYLCEHQIVTRKLVDDRLPMLRRPEGLDRFVRELARLDGKLRVLIVGVGGSGQLPAVEEEVVGVETEIRSELEPMGLEPRITRLIGPDATLINVREELAQGIHFLHYAGPGRFNDALREVGGLLLASGAGLKLWPADTVQQMATEGAELRLVFLSCCASPREDDHTRRGDFYKLLRAFARAGVPRVLGYRWTLDDESARDLALAFYRSLGQTFTPGRALLDARRALVEKSDEARLSPILLSQGS